MQTFTGYPRRACLCCERLTCICLSPGEVPDEPERRAPDFAAQPKPTRVSAFERGFQRTQSFWRAKESA